MLIKPRQPKRRTQFESVANPHPASEAITGGDWQRITPLARLETGDVTTAIYDASISFGLVTVATIGAIAWAGGYIQIDAWRFEFSYSLAPAMGATVALWRYFDGLKLAKGLLEIIETFTDSTDAQPPPKPEPQTVEVKTSTGDGHWQFAELKVEPLKLRALSLAILGGENFTERVAKEAGLTQEEFKELREQFISRGWAAWNHPTRKQQGATLTVSGRTIVRAFSRTPVPPTPH